MKGIRVLLAAAAIALCMTLCGCTRIVRSPADELCMSRWGTETQNGNRAELTFDGQYACFSVVNQSFELRIEGDCFVDDTTLVISDEATQMNYRFTYLLHGDSVELTFGDGTLILEKTVL